MVNYHLEADIKAMYIEADSYPAGVLKAHQQLHGLVKRTENRKYFGISFPDRSGFIIYKAAAEEITDGEAIQLELNTFVIKKGNYISIDIPDFMENIEAIGVSFQKLISFPGIDPNGACIEWYLDDNLVKCMVRLAD
ncbi:transcriptional regulator [Emticicia sp. TH156]|nr:transcriptional regulator [Emticicia sp. TH156]